MADSQITVAGPSKAERKDFATRVAQQLSTIFRTDPALRWVICDMTEQQRAAYLRSWFDTITTASRLNGAVFMETADFGAVAIWLPPGRRVDNPLTIIQAGFIPVVLKLGLGGVKRMLFDFQYRMDKMKARHLPRGQRYHYLFFIGTEEKARGQGLASRLIRERQEVARAEGLPIWLEATTLKSRGVYERCGFVFQEVLVLGAGSHDADGRRKKGGTGVEIHAMVWWPEKKEGGNGN